MRIFHESLSLPAMQSSKRLVILEAKKHAWAKVTCEDTPTFRLVNWDDPEQKLQETLSQDSGENDLHLSTPGHWPPTMYPEIFGISETWLMLLSQVIRLSNEKELAESENSEDFSFRSFNKHAKSLELCILRWENSAASSLSSMRYGDGLSSADVDWILLESMLSALGDALTIYFYRRVRDVEPQTLQFQVCRVRDALIASKELCSASKKYLQGMLWAAFVAGCEALDSGVQASFADWFASRESQHGQRSLGHRMSYVMKSIWDRRRCDLQPVSWMQLMQDVIHPP